MRVTAAQLAQCFDDHAAGLVLYARQWVGADVAEDVVQEAFVRLAGQGKAPENFRAWLIVTVRRAAIDALRGHRRRQVRDTAAGRAFFERQDGEGGWLLPAEVEAALVELPAELREVVVLRVWNGASFQEIAGVRGEPLHVVYGRYRQALETLRKKWGSLCR